MYMNGQGTAAKLARGRISDAHVVGAEADPVSADSEAGQSLALMRR
jgi:hypothetical protein